jgi:hypothetical protein
MTKIIEINAETNEIIERDPTSDEIKDFAKNQKNYDDRILQAKAKENARKDLLNRLGISEDEAKLLLG